MHINKSKISPEFYAILFLWFVVFEWFKNGFPPIHYLIRMSYVLILLRWLYVKFKSRGAFLIPKTVIPLALILLQQIVSLPNSPLPFQGLESVLGYLILAIGALYLIDVLHYNIEPRKLEFGLFSMAFIFCLFNLMDVLKWFKSWWDISGTVLSLPPLGYRLEGVFLHHANVESAFLIFVMPLTFVRLLYQRKLRQRLPWLIFLVIIVIVEYFASSRSAWLAVISGLSTTSLLLLTSIRKQAIDKGLSLSHNLLGSKKRLITAFTLIVLFVVVCFGFLGQLRSTSHAPITSARSKIWNTSWQVFKKSPIVGNGAGSMLILPVELDQIPPGFYLIHAHNLLLQVAAENGVIGVVFLLVAVGFGLKAFFHAWRSVEGQERINLAAYAGVWVGVGVHHLFVIPLGAPIYVLASGIFLELVYRYAPQREYLRFRGRLVVPIIVVLLVVYSLGCLFTLHGSMEHNFGVQIAGEGDWQTTSESVCKAVEKNPFNSLFYFQCGLAQAYVYQDSGEDAVLNSAISMYEDGLQNDPYWPVHWADLAALQWEAGRSSEALQNMLKATDMAPRNATFALNLGRMYEALGQNAKARKEYQQALYNDPWLSEALFFTETPLRSELVQVPPVEVEEPLRKQIAWAGWLLLNSNQPEQARQAFMQALQLKPDYGFAFSGLALADEAQGFDEQARINAETWEIADVDTPLVFLIAGQIAERQGRSTDATVYYYNTYQSAKHFSYSIQSLGILYRRWMLPFDLVPQIEDGVLTLEMRESIYKLVDSLRELGLDEDAQEVLDWITEKSQ